MLRAGTIDASPSVASQEPPPDVAVLREIAEHLDVLVILRDADQRPVGAYVMAYVSAEMLDRLATLDANQADLEPEDEAAPGNPNWKTGDGLPGDPDDTEENGDESDFVLGCPDDMGLPPREMYRPRPGFRDFLEYVPLVKEVPMPIGDALDAQKRRGGTLG